MSVRILAPVTALEQMRQSVASVCFAVDVRSGDRAALERTIQSVMRQTDPSWEIILSAAPELAGLVEEWLDIDWRIRRLPAGTGESLGIIETARVATCRFVGILGQGDLVDDDLVRWIARTADGEPDAEIIYTDEVRKREDDSLDDPFFKPDWSPEHLSSVNYVGRFAALRKTLLLNERSPETRSPEAAEYAILLAAAQRARKIVHVDEPLYIRTGNPRRRVGGFFSGAAIDDARRLLERHVHRENAAARVAADASIGALRVHWPLPAGTPVTLVVLTGFYRREVRGRGPIVLATNFVRSILERSTTTGYRILVVDDGVVSPDLAELLAAHGHESRSYRSEGPFSFARKATFAVGLVESGVVILLNDDLEVISPDWIEVLAGSALRPAIGAVGARLLFDDGSLQHAGITLGFHGVAGHIFHAAKPDGSEYAGFASIERNYSAVTGAVLAFRKAVFDELGGFDERLQIDYNDVDFCLRCIEAGYRVSYTPAATLYHFHNSSLKRERDRPDDRAFFLDRWKGKVARDPFFSKHFQKRHQELPLVAWPDSGEGGNAPSR